jgi:hypothetical protein
MADVWLAVEEINDIVNPMRNRLRSMAILVDGELTNVAGLWVE